MHAHRQAKQQRARHVYSESLYHVLAHMSKVVKLHITQYNSIGVRMKLTEWDMHAYSKSYY